MSITSRISSMEEHVTNAYDELQGLGADLTNVNKNIENISMVLDDIYDSLPSVSDEGTSLTLNDTRVGKIKSTLKGNTSQTGTPTPSSPIPVNVVSGDNEINVCGKNLLENTFQSQTANGITFTRNENGSLSFSGTATQAHSITGRFTKELILKSGVTYTFSLGNKQAGYGIYLQQPGNVNVYYLGVSATNSSLTITPTENTTITQLAIHFPNGNTVNGTTYPMLEVGSSASTYEPYQGNTYSIDLPVENLFDDSTLNNKWVAQNGTITSATGANCIKYNCNANDTYTLSATFGTSSPNNIIVMAFYDSSDTLLNRYVATANTSLTMTYTAPANTSYMYAGHYGIVPTTIQLEKGSKQNNFTPYGTTPIELCKIGNYQDYFYKDSGKWYLHKEIGKVVYTGASGENWQSGQYGTNSYYIALGNREVPTDTTPNYNFTNLFRGVPYSARTTTGENIVFSDLTLGLYIRNTSITSVADLKTMLGTTNLISYYVLATPTTTEITDTTLISQLNALEQAISYENQTNISQVNNDLPFIISASALKEWSV